MGMTPYEQAFQIGTSYAPRTVPSRSILEIELEAREHGLSYGLYLAGHRLEKELEEAAAKRQAELTAMNVKRRKEAKRLMKRRALERAERPKPDRTPRKRYSIAVAEIDLDGNVLRGFPSGKAAAEATGASPSTVCQSCDRYARHPPEELHQPGRRVPFRQGEGFAGRRRGTWGRITGLRSGPCAHITRATTSAAATGIR